MEGMEASPMLCEQVLPKQLHSPLCFSISANTRKPLKFRIRVPCHGNIFQPQLLRRGLLESQRDFHLSDYGCQLNRLMQHHPVH